MIETRVVEDPRVKAAVNSVHMRMLKAMLRPKKRARRRKFTYGLVGERERMVERDWDQEVVREVVVLGILGVSFERWVREMGERRCLVSPVCSMQLGILRAHAGR